MGMPTDRSLVGRYTSDTTGSLGSSFHQNHQVTGCGGKTGTPGLGQRW